ncbi:MAG: diaminopimelate epimerase [Candidatus Aminicenantes bacterium]|nr:diaminopimelate epimerase [Candidatus Aminicenantes bacterium]
MKFTKVHSLGNDFLIINEDETPGLSKKGALAMHICDRHTGVGADGLLLISAKNKEKNIFNFRIFNADGTEAEISGNGLRCAAAYLYHQKKIDSPRLNFITTAGSRECKLIKREKNLFKLKIEMGIPQLSSQDIPFYDGSIHEKIIDYPLSINQKIYNTTVISLGNPHCAIFVDRFPARIEWQQIGREIEVHPFFLKRTNVEFIRVLSRREIEVLFWERGVGETLSSGSGSCAAAVASILKNLTEKKVKVRTSMGDLTVEWEKEKVYQSGPSEIVFEGNYLTNQ